MTRARLLGIAILAATGLSCIGLGRLPSLDRALMACLWIAAVFAFWLANFLRKAPSGSPQAFLRALRAHYSATASAVFTVVITFLLLNLTLDVALKAIERLDRRSSIQHFQQYGDRVYEAYEGIGLSHNDVELLLIESFQRPFVYAPFIQFRERPITGRFVNVHVAGFRDSKNSAPWPPSEDNHNVFVFGGSTTFGYGVPDDHTIAAHLQKHLESIPTSQPVTVYNFASGFYFSTQERILFEKLLLDGHRPGIAIFIDGLNDIGHPDGSARFTGTLADMMDRKADGKKFFLADTGGLAENLPIMQPLHRIRDHVLALRGKAGVEPGIAPTDNVELARVILDRYTTNQRMIRDIAQDYGVQTLFVWQPIPSYKYDLAFHRFRKGIAVPGSPEQRRYEEAYALMDERISRSTPAKDFLNLAGLQVGRSENLYVDEVHYTPEFNSEIAAHIADDLVARGILETSH